jgi:prolyl oligopeptidase
MTQRPELFNAVLCEVPLLDMERYTKLLAGASWVAEYGDPENPQERDALLAYSPFHNVFAEQTYPEVLFKTSAADDRVHPGHARKMAAKMLDQGHKILFWENNRGGHGSATGPKERAKQSALSYAYFWEKPK